MIGTDGLNCSVIQCGILLMQVIDCPRWVFPLAFMKFVEWAVHTKTVTSKSLHSSKSAFRTCLQKNLSVSLPHIILPFVAVTFSHGPVFARRVPSSSLAASARKNLVMSKARYLFYRANSADTRHKELRYERFHIARAGGKSPDMRE